MEEKVKELRQLALAYSIALMNDYVPSGNDVMLDDIDDAIKQNPSISVSEAMSICNKYKGWSVSDLETEVFILIRNL